MASGKPMNFSLEFDPSDILESAKSQMSNAFKNSTSREIESFFNSKTTYPNGLNGKAVKVEGPGLLLINEFLEKKFDDPATQAWMESYFNKNFERIMEESMRKALEHRAKGFAFNKAMKVENNG